MSTTTQLPLVGQELGTQVFSKFSKPVEVQGPYEPPQEFASKRAAVAAAKKYAIANSQIVLGKKLGPASAIVQAEEGYRNLVLTSPLVAVTAQSHSLVSAKRVELHPGNDSIVAFVNGIAESVPIKRVKA